MVKAVESWLSMSDGTRLYIKDYWPDQAPVANIVLMHGLGEHCGRHAHVAQFFTDRGYAVRSYDHRGHGRSEGRRGDVPAETTLLEDAECLIDDWMQAQTGLASASIAKPPLLLGHSMGGLFAARFAIEQRRPLSGLILSSPALALGINAAEKLLLRLLSALAPGLGVSNGLKTVYLSHDAAVVDAYQADPLVHGRISARLLNAMLAAITLTQQQAASLNLPVLMLVAGQDFLVDHQGSLSFFEHLHPEQATLHLYSELYHELFNETEAAKVFADMNRWLDQQHHRLAA